MLYVVEGIVVTRQQLLDANEWDEELTSVLDALRPGETTIFGGGAFAEFEITALNTH